MIDPQLPWLSCNTIHNDQDVWLTNSQTRRNNEIGLRENNIVIIVPIALVSLLNEYIH